MKATQRLFLTATKLALVAEGDPLAAFLYAAPGDDIPDSAVDRFGLVDGGLPKKGGKSAPPSPNKEKRPDEDKSAGSDGDKSGGTTTDDLTVLKGVGAATATALAAAGLDSIGKLALIDPESPPEIAISASAKDWLSWVTQARVLASSHVPGTAPGGLTVVAAENAA
ncbi:hypothetical protein [uncultured Maricaulis sp.]|uniref:hypothetical protein n=1 Tax=uncultured Maricaulis sp. TaxID=174710 RepID=UPI0030DC5517|tara:strand:- start:134471 stop:134971 length:501 start_codon:yes stop_codon:yes gene_type:complete